MSVNGFAIRNAARILKQRILEFATKPQGQTPGQFPPAFPQDAEELDIKDSVIFVKKDPSSMTIAEFVGPAGGEVRSPLNRRWKGGAAQQLYRASLCMDGRCSREPMQASGCA